MARHGHIANHCKHHVCGRGRVKNPSHPLSILRTAYMRFFRVLRIFLLFFLLIFLSVDEAKRHIFLPASRKTRKKWNKHLLLAPTHFLKTFATRSRETSNLQFFKGWAPKSIFSSKKIPNRSFLQCSRETSNLQFFEVGLPQCSRETSNLQFFEVGLPNLFLVPKRSQNDGFGNAPGKPAINSFLIGLGSQIHFLAPNPPPWE